jgi:glycosyltransferase involved in cell wall biosynthesis
MRLALFTDTYAPQVNGVTRTLGRLVAAVRERGGEARVFTTSDPRVAGLKDEVRWPSVACPFYGELRLAAPSTRRVITELQDFQPTLVHVATPFGVGLAARSATRALGIPLVTSYHTAFSAYATYYRLSLLEGPSWSYLRWFHNAGSRTYCPTASVRTELAARGFERLAVWGRGVDRTLFCPRRRSRAMRLRLGVSDDTIVVAYVGRMAKEKGLEELLEAARHVSRSYARIVFAFAGDGPFLDYCRLHAPERSCFLGYLEGAELASFYASADVFVFPSATDTFGNVLLEAMASGLPVIAADTGPTREITANAALRYPPGASGALANAIALLATHAPRRAAQAAASGARSASFGWSAIFDGLLIDYDAVVRDWRGIPQPRGHAGRALSGAVSVSR